MTTLSPAPHSCLPACPRAAWRRQPGVNFSTARWATSIRTLKSEFTRATHVREDSMAAEVDRRLADLAAKQASRWRRFHRRRELPAWLAALPGASARF
jgi:hypothetical protein